MMHSAHFRIPILATLLLPALLTAQTSFYAVTSPVDGMGRLVQVDILTGSESNVLPVSLNDDQVEGCTGMALDPVSGDVFVLAKVGSETRLATIDLGTGVLTERATFTEKFAGIVFDATGTLYGITGDGSNTPETLYTIDPVSGAARTRGGPRRVHRLQPGQRTVVSLRWGQHLPEHRSGHRSGHGHLHERRFHPRSGTCPGLQWRQLRPKRRDLDLPSEPKWNNRPDHRSTWGPPRLQGAGKRGGCWDP